VSAMGDPGLETPVAPLPAAPTPEAPSKKRIVLPSIVAGLRHALSSWAPLLAVLALLILLALTVVAPFQMRMAERLDSGAHAPALAGAPDAYDVEQHVPAGLDGGTWSDAVRLEAPLLESLPTAVFFLMTISWLFGAVAAGGFLGTAVDGRGRPTVGRFLSEGGRWFFRMARVGVVFAVAFVVVGRIVLEAWARSVGPSEAAAASELAVRSAARVREAVVVLFFLWFRAAADLARADLVVFARRSAFLAFLRALGRTIRRPARTLLPALTLGLPAFGLVWALSLATSGLDTGGTWTVVATFVVLQAAVLVRWASRAAVLGADVEVVRSLVSRGSTQTRPVR
jgi:hypothetical protein